MLAGSCVADGSKRMEVLLDMLAYEPVGRDVEAAC